MLICLSTACISLGPTILSYEYNVMIIYQLRACPSSTFTGGNIQNCSTVQVVSVYNNFNYEGSSHH